MIRNAGGVNAILGNRYPGGPQNRIEHNLAILIMLPILMNVTAGKAKATPTIRTFVGPGHMLGLTIGYRFSNMRITTPGTVASHQGLKTG